MSEYYCSNCDGPIAFNADECPKCGGKFGLGGIIKVSANVIDFQRKQKTAILGKNGWVLFVIGIPALAYLLLKATS